MITMAQTTFSIRMDENLKREFESLCNEFGMNMTTAFILFAKAVVRERAIPFTIKASGSFNLKTMEELEESHNS